MNPQYLPQQQYGTPSQGFQNVPLGPPKGGTSANPPQPPPPTSSNLGQLNNLLGKLPSSNLGNFTVLPQRTDETSNNNMDNNMMKPNEGNSNNNEPPRQSFMQNGPSLNGANAIPSSQLPPSSDFQTRVSAQSNQMNLNNSPILQPSKTPPTSTPLDYTQNTKQQAAQSNFQSQNVPTTQPLLSMPPLPTNMPPMALGQQNMPPQNIHTTQFMASKSMPPSMPPTQQSMQQPSQKFTPQNLPLNPQSIPLNPQGMPSNSQGMPPIPQSMPTSLPNMPPSKSMSPAPQNMPPIKPPTTQGMTSNPNMPPPNFPPQNTILSKSIPTAQHNMPPPNIPQQNIPPQNIQPPNMPPQNSPQQNMPPQNTPSQNMPPQNVPIQSIPPQNMHPQNVPLQSMPLRNIPPQNMPPQNIPQQNMPSAQPYQNMPPQGMPPTFQNMPPSQGFQNVPPRSNIPPQKPMQGMPPFPNYPQQNMQNSPQNANLAQNKPPLQGVMPPPSGIQNRPPVGGYNQPLSSGQPPLPTNQYNYNQPPTSAMRPPLPGQPFPNQMGNVAPPQSQYPGQHLANQMQNMSLSGPNKNYPMNNGDNSPHMPPPINGKQARGPAGYPPMPGQPMGGYPQQGGYDPTPQQQARLDPDQVPSPIQVSTDDEANRAGVFVTNQRGTLPPLCTTNFIVQDQGNASPRFIRSSIYEVPISHDIIKQTSVPFCLTISPMARLVDGEYPPPIVNFGELGPVRCIRCKAYMCPFMNFVDAGRRFQCAFCKATTDVPAEYFQHLDHKGQRMDRYERPELVLGTYEFIATADYCRNNVLPKPPAVIFVIDVSYNSVKSGLVHLLCAQMKEIIKNLPVDQGMESSNMKVGFITFNSSVHFYNIKGSLAAPQMLVVGDTQEMFMPLLDGFLSTPEESEAIIDALMEQIPAMYGNTRETETVLLPAILAGLEALKASECAGKLMVFNSSLPSAEAPGKLKNRDDRKLLGTDKERTILTPQNQAYNQLGQDCVQFGCSVDLFLFNNAYIDVATIGQVSRLTGGDVFKYTYFQADIDGDRLISDVIMKIGKPIAFDAIMRVRTSTGVRPTDFYGNFFMSNTTDIELASIDCDKAVAIEIKHDDKLQEGDGVFIQSALLYTSCSGQRRLRVCNLSLKTCSQIADLYKSCNLDTIINYVAKQALFKLMDNNPKAVKDSIVARAAQILANYRKKCATSSSAGQLLLPEFLKLLPLYVNCLLKSDALSGGSDMTVDERSFVIQTVMTMDVPTSFNYFYPRLMPIHDLDPSNEELKLPKPIRCSIEKMTDKGVYILENGIYMFLWMGLNANPEFLQKVFGVQSAMQVNIEQTQLPELDNPLSLHVRNIIEEIRVKRHRNMRLTLVRQREKLEPVFKHFLVEDAGVDGSPSYVDFLCHIHREIRMLLS